MWVQMVHHGVQRKVDFDVPEVDHLFIFFVQNTNRKTTQEQPHKNHKHNRTEGPKKQKSPNARTREVRTQNG